VLPGPVTAQELPSHGMDPGYVRTQAEAQCEASWINTLHPKNVHADDEDGATHLRHWPAAVVVVSWTGWFV
jgi:hypothetical protein